MREALASGTKFKGTHTHTKPSVIKMNNVLMHALAGVAQWIEHRPANWKVTSLIPSQGTCLDCRPVPQLGVCERHPIDVSLTHINVSLPLFLPPFPSL